MSSKGILAITAPEIRTLQIHMMLSGSEFTGRGGQKLFIGDRGGAGFRA